MDSLDTLTPVQKETLNSFQAITASEDLESSIGLLEGVGWDLEVRLRASRLPFCFVSLGKSSVLDLLWQEIG